MVEKTRKATHCVKRGERLPLVSPVSVFTVVSAIVSVQLLHGRVVLILCRGVSERSRSDTHETPRRFLLRNPSEKSHSQRLDYFFDFLTLGARKAEKITRDWIANRDTLLYVDDDACKSFMTGMTRDVSR